MFFMTNSSKYKVPNLERGLLIIDLLSEYPEGLTQSEISSKLQLANSSIYRITMTLLEHDYLHRDDSKKFTITSKFLTIGHRALTENNLIVNSLEVMRELRDETKETILLGSLIDTECVVLEQVLGSHHFKFSLDRGTRIKLHCSAPGKAILAYLSENECKKIINKIVFTKYNANTITDKSEFLKELVQVRKQGYAVDHGEELTGIHCIGAPIFNRYGYPIGTIWTTGPTDRLKKNRFTSIDALMEKLT